MPEAPDTRKFRDQPTDIGRQHQPKHDPRDEVLRHLIENRAQLVTKAALLDAVWPEVAVSDSMPALCVTELRKALGDDAATPHFIETVHGRGYRFIAQVTTTSASCRKFRLRYVNASNMLLV